MHTQECKSRGVWGHAPTRKFSEIRCFEIASEAILGQKQSRSSYMTRRNIASNFWQSMYALVKPADFEFPREMVLRLAEQQVG